MGAGASRGRTPRPARQNPRATGKQPAQGTRASEGVFKNISVVLVEPQSAGNIGSVARAMMNSAITDLVLINPCDYVNNDAFSMACNAIKVLKHASVHPTLEDYLMAGSSPDVDGEPRPRGIVTVGATRRLGKLRTPVLNVDEVAPRVLELARTNRVALVFGREDRGLENTELTACDMLVEIPTSELYPSLNLSHAVLLLCHYIFRATVPEGPSIESAPREEVEMMHAHIERTLRALEYGEKGGEHLLNTILRNFRRLFGRTTLMEKEVAMIRGILGQVESHVQPPSDEGQDNGHGNDKDN